MKNFADRIYNELAIEKTGENLFFSPYSIQVALAMCGRGAKGETYKVLNNLLGLIENLDYSNNKFFELVVANALWAQEGYKLDDEYKKVIVNDYDGAFNTVDYIHKSAEAVDKINSWVSEKTKERIKNLIGKSFIDKNTRLILVNAIYFKGKWQNKFNEKMTKKEEFTAADMSTSKLLMMHNEDKYNYYEDDGYQAIDLLYVGDRLSMLVVLPTKADGLPSLEYRWHEEGLYDHVVKNLSAPQKVVLSLPKFKLETEFSLKKTLCNLGAGLIFSSSADFTGIGNEKLSISEVVHKAFVEVNEEGTEAAAATAVGVMRCASLRRSEPKVFCADHPFMFLIRDKQTNTILFSGHFNK